MTRTALAIRHTSMTCTFFGLENDLHAQAHHVNITPALHKSVSGCIFLSRRRIGEQGS